MAIRPDQVIVALDHDHFDACVKFSESMDDSLRFVKIGSILFSACGPRILEYFSRKNVKIFLDLKFHDIPNTVAHSISSVLKHAPIDLLTIHAGGGSEMIAESKNAIVKANAKTKLLAVTILTSLDEKNLKDIGFESSPENMVVKLANLAVQSGADGIVCSSNELEVIQKKIKQKITIVVPGIRPAFLEKQNDDQKRTATPEYAFEHGASFVVIGRPITQAKNPVEVFQKIIS